MYQNSMNNKYDRIDNDMLAGVYDTTDEDFYDFYSDAIVGRDMTLAIGSAGVTALAMLVHTKSAFLTMMGLFQIILSFPLVCVIRFFRICNCFYVSEPLDPQLCTGVLRVLLHWGRGFLPIPEFYRHLRSVCAGS